MRDNLTVVAPRVPDVLTTARLTLRGQRIDDAAAYHRMWTERDPRVPPHRRIGPDGRPTIDDVAARIDVEMQDPRNGLLTVTGTATGEVLGYCGLLFDGRRVPGEPELAYELLRQAQGLGYATEAGEAVVAWAADAGYERLWAGVRTWRQPSRNVLRKLGFVPSGRVERDAEFGDSLIAVKTLGPRHSSGSPASDA